MIPGTVIAWLLRNWKLAAGGAVLLVLVVALMLTRSTLSSAKRDLAIARQALANEQAAHGITKASVARLQNAVDQQNAIVLERARALEAAKAQAAKDVAAAEARWQDTADQVERLKALSRQPGKAGCEASKALLKELEGL